MILAFIATNRVNFATANHPLLLFNLGLVACVEVVNGSDDR